MNFGELKALAIQLMHRSDLNLNALSPLMCSNVSTSLIVQENEATGAISLTGPNAQSLWSSTLPSDYALMRSVYQTGVVLDPVDIRRLLERGGNCYAISGGALYTTSSSPCSLVYGRRVLPFVSDSDTNSALDHYPDVFLYCLLKHVAAVIQDPEINSEFYEAQFLGAVKTANSLYVDAAFGPGTHAVPMGGLF